ncbi:MAG TPA: hypothetical protein IGS37_18990 [Synechococcales cyanobacterium M55_K2018_004]|nr:hypothetical protein [Synechococcales cyanobacterium M55_K2018_004]
MVWPFGILLGLVGLAPAGGALAPLPEFMSLVMPINIAVAQTQTPFLALSDCGKGSHHPCLAQAAQIQTPNSKLQTRIACPATLDAMIPLLLRDLPSYANRVYQRSRLRSPLDRANLYILIAGRPEFEPLPLSLVGGPAGERGDRRVQQVFFTTRERRYETNQLAVFQNFHWAFFTQTPQGWQLAQMYSRFDQPSANRPPTPPIDSSEGVLAEGIRVWLRDCAAGQIGR